MKRPKQVFLWVSLIGLLIVGGVLIAACQPAPTPEPTPIPPTPTPLPDQSAQLAAWESGPHNAAYDLGKGPNDYCSRCHSPQNWNPASQASAAPTCVTCKFATDAELRISPTMNFVSEEDWVGIPCETCHRVTEQGIVTEGIAWLNPITGEYEEVVGVNALCEKCHANTSGVAFTGGRGVTHKIELGGSAHLNYAGAWPQGHRPDTCSDCHDPHSGEPKACQDCHTDIATSTTHMKGMNAMMIGKVECIACHNSSDMDVAPDPETGMFTTVVTAVGRTGKVTTTVTYSHELQWTVSCDRCHFVDNPWTLTVLNADGSIPAPAAAPTAAPTKP